MVVDEDGITLVDTLSVPSQAEPFAAAVEALGLPIRRVILTSSHVEYAGGSSRFWRAAMYGTAQASTHLDQPPNIDGYRRLFPDLAGDFDDEFRTRPISHVVDEAAYVSGAVMAIPVSGQMDENLVALVPGADVLFAGAMCSFGVTPLAFQGDPARWADALVDLSALASVIVPGHGPVGGADDVLALQAYLLACVDAEGDPGAIPPGPWDGWPGRDLDEINVERAAMLARGDSNVPPTLLRRIGLA